MQRHVVGVSKKQHPLSQKTFSLKGVIFLQKLTEIM